MVRRQRLSTPGQRSRAQGGTVVDVITVIIILGLVAYAVYWVMKAWGKAGQEYATAIVNTQKQGVDVACRLNLDAIYKTIQTYALSNEEFPSDQQELVSFSGYGSKLFHCPDPNGGEYIYVPGRRTEASAPAVLVYESKPIHNGKANVLLSDGQVVPLRPEELQQALAATPARRR